MDFVFLALGGALWGLTVLLVHGLARLAPEQGTRP